MHGAIPSRFGTAGRFFVVYVHLCVFLLASHGASSASTSSPESTSVILFGAVDATRRPAMPRSSCETEIASALETTPSVALLILVKSLPSSCKHCQRLIAGNQTEKVHQDLTMMAFMMHLK